MEPATSPSKLIHAARIHTCQGVRYLFLRQSGSHRFTWYQEEENLQREIETAAKGLSREEALQNARRLWKMDSFRTVNCGFRYSLPERDEHGNNAFFHEMAASYSTPNGVYFDPELGYPCFVNFASLEARNLWERLKAKGRA